MNYTLQIRSQHSRGSSSNRFGGPDKYVAVTIAPAGVEVPYALNGKVLAKRGITLKYFGEGYSRNFGPRSMFGRAIAEAEAFIASAQRNVSTIDAANVSVPDAYLVSNPQGAQALTAMLTL